MVVREAVWMHYCSNKASRKIRKQIRKTAKNMVNVYCNRCYWFRISIDRLSRSVWTGRLKGRSIAVMLLDGISNDQGIHIILKIDDQWWQISHRLTTVSQRTLAIAGVRTVQPYRHSVSTRDGCLLIAANSPIYARTYIIIFSRETFVEFESFAARSFILLLSLHIRTQLIFI